MYHILLSSHFVHFAKQKICILLSNLTLKRFDRSRTGSLCLKHFTIIYSRIVFMMQQTKKRHRWYRSDPNHCTDDAFRLCDTNKADDLCAHNTQNSLRLRPSWSEFEKWEECNCISRHGVLHAKYSRDNLQPNVGAVCFIKQTYLSDWSRSYNYWWCFGYERLSCIIIIAHEKPYSEISTRLQYMRWNVSSQFFCSLPFLN